MSARFILFAIILAIYLGIGIGTAIRVDKKIPLQSFVLIIIDVPLFALLGLIVWTVEFIRDLRKTKTVKLRYGMYIYIAYFKILPYMCELFALKIVTPGSKKQNSASKQRKKVDSNEIKNIYTKGYQIVLEGIS